MDDTTIWGDFSIEGNTRDGLVSRMEIVTEHGCGPVEKRWSRLIE